MIVPWWSFRDLPGNLIGRVCCGEEGDFQRFQMKCELIMKQNVGLVG